MISIVTAVHNQIGMNRLFHEGLIANTVNPYQLIIIDNNSKDGSREYFWNKGATLIENSANLPYAVCQNQGLDAADHDILVFLNNDVVVPPQWDERALKIMNENGLEIASCSGTNRLMRRWRTRWHNRKWAIVRRVVGLARGTSYSGLKAMHTVMFPNWRRFCDRVYHRYGSSVVEGFAGFNIFATRAAIDKVGRWDERVTAADFDIFLRTKQRSISRGDIKPLHLITGVYLHHYGRLTCRSAPDPMVNPGSMLSIREKWGRKEVEALMKDQNAAYQAR